MNRVFFDTNILFYAFDASEPTKQQTAQALIRQAVLDGNGYTSAQVLGEFFHATVLRKKMLTADKAEAIICGLGSLHILEVDFPMVRYAIDSHRRFQTSYWDGLILSAAKRGKCETVLSEDFNVNQNYDGVTVVNPFQ
jgi:predicted nucleic acid-binding protein